MATVEKMIELLSYYPKNMEVTNECNLPFIHICSRQGDKVTLSTVQPIGYCNKCGDNVYPSDLKTYTGICTTCDENLYTFEITSKNKK